MAKGNVGDNSRSICCARNVAVAPGTTFGSVAEQYMRVSLAASDEEIVRGVQEMCAFADGY